MDKSFLVLEIFFSPFSFEFTGIRWLSNNIYHILKFSHFLLSFGFVAGSPNIIKEFSHEGFVNQSDGFLLLSYQFLGKA